MVQEENSPQSNQKHFLSIGQGDRFDRWVEFVSAIVLSLATVLTAWCGYQAAIWGGEQALASNAAAAARIHAAQLANQSMLRSSIQVGLFVEYASAISQENEALADFLYQRFPAELKTATDAWLATKPLTNPDAPLSPFDMAEYVLPERAEAQLQEELVIQKTEEASQADQHSDDYVLLTVIFAMALFFGGISGKFQWRVIDAAMLSLSGLVMAGGLVLLIRYPIG
jgi:hypothetical protein